MDLNFIAQKNGYKMLMTSKATACNQQAVLSGRIDYIDIAKGIFIIIIIVAHHLLGAEYLVRCLYAIGIAPFLLITGFLYAHKREWEQPFGKMCVRKAQKLLYPFVTFSIVNLLWNVLYYKVVFPSAVPGFSIKEMFIFTVSTYGYNALWYLPCAFLGSLLFFVLRRQKHHDWICACLAIFIVTFYVLFDKKMTGVSAVSYIYCYLLRIGVSVVFLYAGSVLFAVFRNMNKTRENLLLVICSVFSLVIVVLYWLYPAHFPTANIAVHRMGNPYVYFPAAISNTIVILLISKRVLGRSRVLTYFGQNSLILMALHMDVTDKIAWWLFPKLGVDLGETINSVIVIGMELLMFAGIIPIINRFFPYILTPKKVNNR